MGDTIMKIDNNIKAAFDRPVDLPPYPAKTSHKEKIREAILDKGLIPNNIVEQMTLNEMIEHLVRYNCGLSDQVWIPDRLRNKS